MIVPDKIRGMEHPSILGRMMQAEGLSELERAMYLHELRASIRSAYEEIGASLQAALAVVVETELDKAAHEFKLPPAVLVRMATDPACPDVALLISGLEAARRLRDLPIEAICDVRDALNIVSAEQEAIEEMARLLCRVADQVPVDGPVWGAASVRARLNFHHAVAYARTLRDSQ